MNVNFSGYNENVVTFETGDNTVVMGRPVKMTASDTVDVCANSETFCGVALNVRNGYAAVQLSGYIEMPTDETFTVGYNKIACAGNSKVKSSDTGREYLVVHTAPGVVGFIL